MNLTSLIALTCVFVAGLLIGAALKPMASIKILPPPLHIETVRDTGSIPELVANQLRAGDPVCPNPDPLTYETCLLYQGTLGIWQVIGLPEICPDVVDERWQPPVPKKGPSLTVNDILRAFQVPCFAYLYAIQVANLTPVLISTANRTFRVAPEFAFEDPGSNPNLCLTARHGICGNQAAVGIALLEKAGFRARPVEFYYFDKQRFSHIIAEVLIEGDWRPIDTTYGAYWVRNVPGKPFRLMSLDDLLSTDLNTPDTKMIHHQALFPYSLYGLIGHPPNHFAYLNPRSSILRGGKGWITLTLKGDQGMERFANLPHYIGDTISDGENNGVSYNLEITPGTYDVLINLVGSGLEGKGDVAICIDNNCRLFSETIKTYQISTVNPKRLYLKSNADVAYVVMDSFEWKRVM